MKFIDSQPAWDVLEPNFWDDKRIIRPISSFYRPTLEDFQAIVYLCDEWDYSYESLG